MATKTMTTRQEHLRAMEAAEKDRSKCWDGFTLACEELSEIASGRSKFSAKEKKAAIALSVVARVEGGLTDIMKTEFANQYRILGAPGDFGYSQPEGKALQAVYEWWNKLVVSKKPDLESRG